MDALLPVAVVIGSYLLGSSTLQREERPLLTGELPSPLNPPPGCAFDARCAFALSFDADHETNELRDGGKSIGRMAWGEYGTRVGVPRILKLLKKYDVPATFYVPAVAAMPKPAAAGSGGGAGTGVPSALRP